jgi:hypothetical protein
MKQYGSVYLYRTKKHVRVPYSDAEYVEWLRRRVRDFREIAEEAGLVSAHRSTPRSARPTRGRAPSPSA